MNEKEKHRLFMMAVKLMGWAVAAVVMLLGVWCGWVRAWFGVCWIVGFAMMAAIWADRMWRRWAKCARE